jgi:AcrR family transcriptional regulator
VRFKGVAESGWHNEGVTDKSVRRGRRPLISREQVLDAASDALAHEGVDAVSLRAIARRLGVVSSAMYRHYASRDDLVADLTRRCDASLGESVASAESSVPRGRPAERLAAVVNATREWARGHPYEYALLFGADGSGHPVTGSHGKAVLALIERLAGDTDSDGPASPGSVGSVVVEVWSQLFGHVSFEVFGNYAGVVADPQAFTNALIESMVERLGLSSG